MKKMSFLVFCLLLLFSDAVCGGGWGFSADHGRILLRDISTLTLHSNRMTQGRRSTVPQLKCVGGSAANLFNPQTVQCYNKGFDGSDVQWECKADMDNSYRFGTVEVVCEGYDYPDDPYITSGSCGLEYTIELTKEGQQSKSSSYSYGFNYGPSYGSYKSKSASSWIGDLIFLAGIALVIYVFYVSCLSGNYIDDRQYSSTNNDYPGGYPSGSGGGWFGGDTGYGPSAPGYSYDGTCSGNRYRRGTGAGNFWTGMATGGLLGYMFGNRGNSNYNRGYENSYGWGSGGSRSFFGGSSPFSGSSGMSTGTRTASGYGGTRRR